MNNKKDENNKPVMTGGMFTSRSEDWATPQYLIDYLSSEFNFMLDVCADNNNAKAENFYTKIEDGLTRNWQDALESIAYDVKPRSLTDNWAIWLNPPYGKTIYKWLEKAYEESQNGRFPIVCLVHARTDTKWFHEVAMKADEIRLIKGRLSFGDSKNSAPFPSCLVIFRPLFGSDNIYNTPKFSSIVIPKT